jgi:hypothetical protein
MAPAFKEWQVIVEALGAGEQVLILRKGGIAEDHGGFRVKHDRFWLFPTQFHEQLARTKPAAAKFWQDVGRVPSPANTTMRGSDFAKASTDKEGTPPTTSEITLRFWAEIVRSSFLTDWAQVAALDAQHLWIEPVVRERFEWGRQPGIFALIVRVHRLNEPVVFTPTVAMAGCKSWVELPYDFAALPSTPVLDDTAFARKLTPSL